MDQIPAGFYNGFEIDDGDISARPFVSNQGKIEVKSWNGLQKAISFFTRGESPWYWRGHADENWKIESTAARSGLRQQQVDQQLKIFQKAARPLVQSPKTDDEFSVLGRHHGLSTTLVDFSESAYKALFFACEQEEYVKLEKDNNRAIWLFDRRNFEGWDGENSIVEIVTFANNARRLIAQDGLILKLPLDKSLNGILDDLSGGDKEPLLFCISFPEDIRETALINLAHMGISYRSMYPDLEGAAKFANMSSKIKRYQKLGVNIPESPDG